MPSATRFSSCKFKISLRLGFWLLLRSTNHYRHDVGPTSTGVFLTGLISKICLQYSASCNSAQTALFSTEFLGTQ
jgi:hypothetical protein